MNFFARYKKLWLALAFLALVVVLGYLLWRAFFRPVAITPVATTTPGTITGLPTIGEGGAATGEEGGPANLPSSGGPAPAGGGIPAGSVPTGEQAGTVALGGLTETQSLTKTAVIGSTASGNGVQYYDENDGRFYRLGPDGEPKLLSDKVFHLVQDVVWAPDKNKAVLEYPDGNKILYDFATGKQVTLPAHWEDFSFSPDSARLVSKSLGLDPENRWLVVSDANGANARALEAIGNNADTVYPSWSPNKQIVAYYTQGVDFNRQEVFFVGLNGENFKSTVVEGRGLETQWSPSGDRLLYSVYNTDDNLNPRLWIVDAAGDTIGANRRSLDLQTWADKCTFASNTEIYCAVPEYLERGAGLFPELAGKTKDDLYKIDLTTGTQRLLAVPDGSYNISQVMVSADQSCLYFTDESTGRLYKINLK